MSDIHTECPCGKSHAGRLEMRPEESVECDCGRVLRVLCRSLRAGRVVSQRLTIVREARR